MYPEYRYVSKTELWTISEPHHPQVPVHEVMYDSQS